MRKLKRNEVAGYKKMLRHKQGGICPLCLKELPTAMAQCALDHDHTTGEVRGLLHMGCNKAEGSIFNSIGRWGGTGKDYDAVVPYLKRMLEYIQAGGQGVIYHLHKTPEEKAEAQRKRNNARARARRRMNKENLK